ncbi:hypothetical protein Tco_1018831 [Tanacetum coccineum]|uniref:Uncharacterized protein n=1 Tax=Tanacetum coccineum TaxID=301880 RepID=A0ABQ5FVE5_9ASTR
MCQSWWLRYDIEVLIVVTSRYVVPTGRVKVLAGRYVVPTGKDNIIVSAGRSKVIPAGRTILVLGLKWVLDDPLYVTGGEPEYPQELFSAVDLLSL